MSTETSIGLRSFRKVKNGALSQEDVQGLEGKARDIQKFADTLNSPSPIADFTIATTTDLPQEGINALSSTGLKVLVATDTFSSDLSNANFLNSYLESTGQSIKNCVIASPSIVGNKEEEASTQVKAMVKIFEFWEKQRPGKIAMIGSAIEGEHNPELIEKFIEGSDNIGLNNMSVATPNNSLNLLRPELRFSKTSDNGVLGKIWFGTESARVGGNEDFFLGFTEMIKGNDVVLLIDPIISGERKDKVDLGEKKYLRRQSVFEIFATEIIIEAMDRGIIPFTDMSDLTRELIGRIVEDTLDKHLFFAKIDQNSQPEIVLTRRQRSMVPSF